MPNLTAIIVDDEPHARDIISLLLQDVDDIEVISSCDNGGDAITLIKEQQPDIVFLDIQMPEIDGFEVVNSISKSNRVPQFIFITAFDEFAIKAFEVNAIDYILKPFDATFFTICNHKIV